MSLGRKVWRNRIRPLLKAYDAYPDFLILGAQKAGTTWLAYLLSRQQTILKPKVKEVGYFTEHYRLGPRWYRSHFTPTFEEPSENRPDRGFLRYDATPDYLYDPLAAERIGSDLKQARLIVLMRDPVRRAVSGYHHMVRTGHEHRPIEAALKGPELQPWPRHAQRFAYIDRGRYAWQIEMYLKHFDRRRMKLILFEDLIAQPEATLEDLSGFLETPLRMPADREVRNPGHYEFELSADLERFIREETEESSAAVFDMLGRPRLW